MPFGPVLTCAIHFLSSFITQNGFSKNFGENQQKLAKVQTKTEDYAVKKYTFAISDGVLHQKSFLKTSCYFFTVVKGYESIKESWQTVKSIYGFHIMIGYAKSERKRKD